MATSHKHRTTEASSSQYDVFIAYAGPDIRYATDVFEACVRKGLTVFLDARSLRGGDRIFHNIVRALERSRLIAVLVSRRTPTAWFVDDEVMLAVKRVRQGEAKVVPVLIGRASSTYGLMGLQPLKLSILPGKARYDELAMALSSLLEERVGAVATSDGRPAVRRVSYTLPAAVLTLIAGGLASWAAYSTWTDGKSVSASSAGDGDAGPGDDVLPHAPDPRASGLAREPDAVVPAPPSETPLARPEVGPTTATAKQRGVPASAPVPVEVHLRLDGAEQRRKVTCAGRPVVVGVRALSIEYPKASIAVRQLDAPQSTDSQSLQLDITGAPVPLAFTGGRVRLSGELVEISGTGGASAETTIRLICPT